MMKLVLMRTATGNEDPELPLLQRISSLELTVSHGTTTGKEDPALPLLQRIGCITACYGNCSASDPEVTTECRAYDPVHHWGQASWHSGPLYQAVLEEGPKNCQRLQQPKS